MKKILITGASGFVGGYLAEYLLNQNKFKIIGTFNHENSLNTSIIKNKIQFKKIDLLDFSSVMKLINESMPDYIFHLAGASSPAESFIDPVRTYHINLDSQSNILEALRLNNQTQTGILIVSSSEVYGRVSAGDLPVNENTPLKPVSPYAVSKISQEFMALQYNLTYGIKSVRVRPFNHIGPRQRLKFVVTDFSKQIAQIEKDQIEPVIKVGNLEAKKDFTDVRDIVRAYYLLMEKGLPGEVYNIGSGKAHGINEILNILLELSNKKIAVHADPAKMRPGDIPNVACDNKKLCELTGWNPEISLKQTLQDTLDYWRSIV